MSDEYLSVAQIAERMGLAKLDSVYVWIKSGELPAVDVSGKRGGRGRATWRVAVEDFEKFLLGRRSAPPAPIPRPRRLKLPPVIEYV